MTMSNLVVRTGTGNVFPATSEAAATIQRTSYEENIALYKTCQTAPQLLSTLTVQDDLYCHPSEPEYCISRMTLQWMSPKGIQMARVFT